MEDIRHQIGTMGNYCLWKSQGIIRNQHFLGGAKSISQPSTVGIKWCLENPYLFGNPQCVEIWRRYPKMGGAVCWMYWEPTALKHQSMDNLICVILRNHNVYSQCFVVGIWSIPAEIPVAVFVCVKEKQPGKPAVLRGLRMGAPRTCLRRPFGSM